MACFFLSRRGPFQRNITTNSLARHSKDSFSSFHLKEKNHCVECRFRIDLQKRKGRTKAPFNFSSSSFKNLILIHLIRLKQIKRKWSLRYRKVSLSIFLKLEPLPHGSPAQTYRVINIFFKTHFDGSPFHWSSEFQNYLKSSGWSFNIFLNFRSKFFFSWQ